MLSREKNPSSINHTNSVDYKPVMVTKSNLVGLSLTEVIKILLLLPPECWGSRHGPLCLVLCFMFLETEPKASSMLAKCSTKTLFY